ncbi:PPC domain-containing DNA-binding protein [Acidisphaera sp. S103]|uniref:PPC domain-containing DNA-binding protein n=1 Tax=Acidisphaera sp. S103 TaxID=1747223 RepID=UPI00131E52EA|nr:PPC domain-containing DNA-binding protein [Acidisphaera sp. S103]
MKSKCVAQEADQRTFVLILDQGEEAFACISRFAEQNNLTAASLTALGAFESAKVGWFDIGERKYHPISVKEQCEVLSLIGDIATGDDGKPSLHVHAVLGLSDGTTRGGHLMQAIVLPTLEVTVVESAAHLRRKKRADLGLAFIDLS